MPLHSFVRAALALVLSSCAALAIDIPGPREAMAVDESPAQRDARLAWWRAARFGLFIHWGPVSLKGTEIGWSRGGERRGTGGKGEIPVDVYDNLYEEFNPTRFDADEWARIALDAGMRYLVFTTKHHDGFVNFDSALTDFKITSPASPFRRDIVRELTDACRRAGLPFGAYYSPPDWHHPDFRTSSHAAYIEYMHGQVRELCTNYGRMSILWFDGLGGTAEDWGNPGLERMIRSLQPRIIINNRAGLAADYDTPEQHVGSFQIERPWETCMTICRQWAWKPNDELKSLKECLQTLVRVTGGDGNFLFNVGPMPDGRIEPRQVDRLREMGAWLRQYGQTIYGTRGGPYRWCACSPAGVVATRRGRVIYLHVLDWNDDMLKLPPLPARITRSWLLTGGNVDVRQSSEGVTVYVPPGSRQEIDTIVALHMDTPVEDLLPIPLNGIGIPVKSATTSNVFQKSTDFDPMKAFDNDPATRWATDAGTREAWIEADLDTPQTVRGVGICEEFHGRIQQYEILCRKEPNDAWATVYRGGRLKSMEQVQFDPVTARYVRLHVIKANEGPTISEIQILQ